MFHGYLTFIGLIAENVPKCFLCNLCSYHPEPLSKPNLLGFSFPTLARVCLATCNFSLTVDTFLNSFLNRTDRLNDLILLLLCCFNFYLNLANRNVIVKFFLKIFLPIKP